MKRLAKRTVASLLLVAIFLVGFSIYLFRYLRDGDDWVSFPVNRHAYSNGVLATGTIVDRNGVVLAGVLDGQRVFSDNYYTRRATLHVVGDAAGNIGTGLLSQYDTRLMGYNFIGGVYSVTGEGNTVHTTLDESLCRTALDALGYNNGAVVVFNYKTGDVLVMVSTPGFDPVDPPDLSNEESGSRYDGAYINRCVSSTFTPGSIYKTVVLEAAIEKFGDDLYDMEFYCPGSVQVAGETINCSGVHGTVNIHDAFARSCNCAFAELSLLVGSEDIAKYAKKAGLTSGFTISGIPVAAGNYDSWNDGTAEFAWSGIGQSTDLVNPLAVARFMGAIANGGSVVEPRIVSGVTTPIGLPAAVNTGSGSVKLLDKNTAEMLKDMMLYNVTSYYGSRFDGLYMGAKSGTAEVGDGKSPHAWYVGFLDDPDNPLAFAVFVENGGWGVDVAGAVANRVLREAVNS